MHHMLITDPTNIRYVTGFVGVSPEEREAYVLLTGKKTRLFLTPLYREEGKQFGAREFSRDNPVEKQLANILTRGSVLEFEQENLTVAEYGKLKKALPGIRLVAAKNTIEERRKIKSKDELAHVRLAAKITDQCFAFIKKRLRPGVTEGRIAFEIEGYIRAKGASLAFAPIVAFNEHSSQPHYHGKSHNPLRRGSLVLLDFGARVNGYCADLSRVVFVGEPKPEWKKAYDVVKRAQEAALARLRPGASGADADAAAREVIRSSGYPEYPHGLGHGVGLAIHEAPRLSIKNPSASSGLRPGMVVTVEPGIYIPGSYGIRLEDLVLLNKNGIEKLSQSPL